MTFSFFSFEFIPILSFITIWKYICIIALFSELLAYRHLVSVFRAQGDLSKEKRKVLSEVQSLLNIPTERHKAEVRRAVNDEVLYTVAE